MNASGKSWTEQFVTQNADSIRERLATVVGRQRGDQARVSRETGIRANHLNQLLSGKNTLHLRHIVMISKSLGVNLAWLMTGEGHPGDVDAAPPAAVSSRHADSEHLSPNQVGKLLAAAERDRLTPDERVALAKYQSLPPSKRARFIALLDDVLDEAQGEPRQPTVHEPGTRKEKT